MSHSYCTNLVHCVFSTKDRTPSIPAERQEQLWAYLDGIANNHHMPLLAMGGIANHVHLLVAIPQTTTVASAINRFKANSSRWLHEHGNHFEWQKGYGAFSFSPSQVPAVKEYIRTQAEHHVKHTFEDEFFRCCANAAWNSIPNTFLDRCRAAGAPLRSSNLSHRCRGGLTNSAPPVLAS